MEKNRIKILSTLSILVNLDQFFSLKEDNKYMESSLPCTMILDSIFLQTCMVCIQLCMEKHDSIKYYYGILPIFHTIMYVKMPFSINYTYGKIFLYYFYILLIFLRIFQNFFGMENKKIPYKYYMEN